jgi:short-subunit dehydrogenase
MDISGKNKKNILITGTSSGIGRSCARILGENNYRVFACVRKHSNVNSKDIYKPGSIIPLIMDVSSEESINKAFDEVNREISGEGLYGLINNAAIAIGGPVETSSMEIIKEQFEVNLFGQIRVIQKFLPLLRTGKGKIINISSTNGFISYPYMGIYCSTKFAFEAVSDALRIELSPWNIPVSVINPDKIKSRIWEKSITISTGYFNALDEKSKLLYKDSFYRFVDTVRKIEKSALAPEVVVKSIIKALESDNPRFHYLPGIETKLMYLMSVILPKRLLNILIKKELRKG